GLRGLEGQFGRQTVCARSRRPRSTNSSARRPRPRCLESGVDRRCCRGLWRIRQTTRAAEPHEDRPQGHRRTTIGPSPQATEESARQSLSLICDALRVHRPPNVSFRPSLPGRLGPLSPPLLLIRRLPPVVLFCIIETRQAEPQSRRAQWNVYWNVYATPCIPN